jgi:purine nucleoside permease
MRLMFRPLLAALTSLTAISSLSAADKIPIKVIVVSCFEVGDDTGDAPGEFQFWAEREKLTDKIEVPGAPHALCRNAEGLYGTVAGNTRDTHLTAVRTSELIMALCLDPRWDLRKTYWLINGIAGIDPASGSIGSAVWTTNVVDGDALREIGETEMPASWRYGLFAIGTTHPDELPKKQGNGGWGGAELAYTMNYPLNGALTRWAYEISKNVEIPDSAPLKEWREKYRGFPEAQKPPHVMMGDSLGTARYWHGEKRTEWARNWVKLWTDGKGVLSTTAMEHQDYMATLTEMASKGFLDKDRILMLRTASNYCMPPPGQSVESTIGDESLGTNTSLEAAYRSGSVVVHELLKNWPRYEDKIPGS